MGNEGQGARLMAREEDAKFDATVYIARSDGTLKTSEPCIMVGRLCVHRGVGKSGDHWRITHHQTGLALPSNWDDLERAVACATEIDALADWDDIVARHAQGDSDDFALAGQKAKALIAKHGNKITKRSKYVVAQPDLHKFIAKQGA